MTDATPKRLVILDGHSLAYRAFYAMPPLHTRRGDPINAVLGFTNMLLKTIEVEAPQYVALSFDRGLPTERVEAFAEYKAQRESMPEGLGAQLPVIEALVRSFGIPIFTSDTHEADDCIGTLARRGEEMGLEVVIVSGDLDMLQLVSPLVRVMATIRGVADTVRYDVKAVWDRYGFAPALIPDFKALAGDASDNIPGVVGIGKGTASKLIQDFGSLDALLERLDEVPPRWRDKIRDSVDAVRSYRDIATIITDLDLDVSWDQCAWSGVPQSGSDMLTQLEFFKIVERLKLSTSAPTEEEAAAAVTWPAVDVRVASDEAALARAATALQGAPMLGLAWIRDARSVALAVAADETTAHVLLLQAEAADQPDLFAAPPSGWSAERAAAWLGEVLRGGAEAWTFDLKAALVEWGDAPFAQAAALGDVGVASYLLESGESQKSLQAIAVRHERRRSPEREAVLGRGVKAQTWRDAEPQVLAQFAGETAASTRAVASHLRGRLEEEGLEPLFRDMEMPMAWVLARMEKAGVRVDTAYLRQLAVEMDRDLDQIQTDVLALAGAPFNLNSPKQLGDVLFDRLQIPGGKKTKTGAYTTDAEMLGKLAAEYPICRRIMDYREVAKLKSTYVDAFPRLVQSDGRLRSSWNSTVAATGRLSSSDPNLQNIPIRSELGRRIRRAFVAAPGNVLLSADYSQIELRIMAHFSGDAALVQVFNEGGDVHLATAAEIFGVERAEVTQDMRRKAKEINFGIMYGMGPEGLSQRIHVSRREARVYIDKYLENFAGVRAYTEGAIRQAEEKGYVTTLSGRRRYLPDIHSRNRMIKAGAERMAVNAPIQGTAADLVKIAMVALHGMADAPKMIMQVHDELVFEVPRDRVLQAAALVRPVMEGALELSVPIHVDIKAGANWAEMEAVHAVPSVC